MQNVKGKRKMRKFNLTFFILCYLFILQFAILNLPKIATVIFGIKGNIANESKII
jgi:hypothetical protein